MKRMLMTAAVGLFATSLMLAQGRFGPRGEGGTAPDPATRIASQVARLTTLLDLTTSQASQATSILTTEQSSVSTLQTTVNTNQTALRAAIQTNAISTIDQLSTGIGTLSGQILSIRSKSQASLYALLTSTQQTKLAAAGGIGALGGAFGGPGGRGPRRD